MKGGVSRKTLNQVFFVAGSMKAKLYSHVDISALLICFIFNYTMPTWTTSISSM